MLVQYEVGGLLLSAALEVMRGDGRSACCPGTCRIAETQQLHNGPKRVC